MLIAPLVLVAALAAVRAADDDPTALVAKLGSADSAERAAATESLKALGRAALPALEKAMKADDANVRKRVSALWETIERDLMTRPSLVQLDGHGRPMGVVLEDVERQTGMTLQRDQSGPEPRRDSRRAGPGLVLDGARTARVVGRLLSEPGRRQVPEARPPRSARAAVHLDRRPVPGLVDGPAPAPRPPVDPRPVGSDRSVRTADQRPGRGPEGRFGHVLRRASMSWSSPACGLPRRRPPGSSRRATTSASRLSPSRPTSRPRSTTARTSRSTGAAAWLG